MCLNVEKVVRNMMKAAFLTLFLAFSNQANFQDSFFVKTSVWLSEVVVDTTKRGLDLITFRAADTNFYTTMYSYLNMFLSS
jgi:hypothetical protein